MPPRKTLREIDWLSPLRALAYLDLLLALLFGAWTYVVFFMMQTTLTSQLSSTYHLDEILIGVCYLGSGGGSVAAGYSWGKVLDLEYRRIKTRFDRLKKEGEAVDDGDFPIEKARLRTLCESNPRPRRSRS